MIWTKVAPQRFEDSEGIALPDFITSTAETNSKWRKLITQLRHISSTQCNRRQATTLHNGLFEGYIFLRLCVPLVFFSIHISVVTNREGIQEAFQGIISAALVAALRNKIPSDSSTGAGALEIIRIVSSDGSRQMFHMLVHNEDDPNQK